MREEEGATAVCVIGLGQMGLPIATRLIGAGFSVSGFDPSADARKRFADAGGKPAESAREAAAGTSAILTLLPNGAVVRAALLGHDGALADGLSGTPPRLVIDMSSSEPTSTVALGSDLARLGAALVDAPVSGGVKRAVEGKLTVMLGGEEAAAESARRILAPVALAIHRTGALGSGHAMKALNNFVSACGTAAAMEALIVAERFGIAPETLIDVLNGSSGSNNATQVKMKQFVLSKTFASGFATGLMAKDVGIAATLARSLNLSLPVLDAMATLWKEGAAALGERSDHTEMARYLESRAAGRST